VKILKVILLLFLICKTSFVFGLELIPSFNQSCCTESVSLSCENSEPKEEKSNCCGNVNCECLCCAHVFTFTKVNHLKLQPHNLLSVKHISSKDKCSPSNFIQGVWQPPKSY